MFRFSSRLDPPRTNRLSRAIETRRASGAPLIDLTESNPTRAGFDYPPDLLAPLGHPEGLRYAPSPLGVPAAREAVAADYARRGVAVDANRVALTASTSEAYSILFKLLCDNGDEVLVPQPSYPLFEHLTRLDGIVAKPYQLEFHGRWSIDLETVAQACSPRTRAILMVTPNNPTGSFVGREEWAWLAARCAERQIAVIADEVFADYELRKGAAARAGQVLGSTSAGGPLAFSLGGLSKTAGLPQVKLGWIAVGGPEPLVRETLERLEFVCDAYLSVSTPVQLAAPALLNRGASVREQIHHRVRSNFDRLHAAVATCPSLEVLTADAGWYAVVRVPSLESEEDLVVRLVEQEGVLAHPGYFYDFAAESYVIVSLLPPPTIFDEGVARVVRHFACIDGTATP